MVNKVAVVLVGGIVVVGVVVIGGVAALVLGSGGPGGQQTSTPLEATPLPSPGAGASTTVPPATPTPTATQAPTPTGTAVPTLTPTATPRPTVLPSEFDEREIERIVAQLVNQRRRAADLEPLELEGSLAEDVSAMARDHSEAMAEVGEATHVVDGNHSANRYRSYELYTNCEWVKPGEEGFARPDANGLENSKNGFEAVASTVAGREYEAEVNGETRTRFNADERDVAEAVVQEWWNTSIPPYPQRLTLPNARYLGVGVEVTQYGEVYVTANLC